MILKSIPTLLLAIVIASCHESAEKHAAKQKSKPALTVDWVVAQPSVLEQSITVSGTLKPFDEATLMPEVSGRVVTLNLDEGQWVRKGTLLVKIFDGELQAQLQKAKTQLQIAEQTYQRQEELVKVSGLSQADFDQTLLQINSIKGDVEVLKAQIRKTEVLAPFDGVIGLRNISLGAVVNPNTNLATIRNLQQLKLDFSIPEKYANEVKTGTKLRFTIHGDTTVYDASVIATEQSVETLTRNLRARALIANQNAQLTPGTFANIELDLNTNPHALLVPSQALIPQARNKKAIIAKNGKATFVDVKTGIRQASSVEITSGIAAGDTVITTGVLFLKQGDRVKLGKKGSGKQLSI